MKPLNLSGKILLIPMDQLPQDTRDTLRREDGMQTIAGTNVFVYATGRVVSGCCCGGGHHHHEDGHECCGGGHHHHEDGHECCGGGHHHHEDGHECCGGGHHHHEEGHECCGGGHHHEDGHECCGGGHHHHEDGHECCGGGHHHHEEGHECCGGGRHHHEEGHECCGGHHHHEDGHEYNADEADETFFEPEDLAYGKDEPITETIDDNLLLVVNEPVIIVNTSDAARIGFDVSQARPFDLPPEGVTLVPGRDVDKGYFQTGPISIQLRD